MQKSVRYVKMIQTEESRFQAARRLVTKESSGEELTDFVIEQGRIQAMIAVAVICGFVLFGREFICLWIGPAYWEAWGVGLMLLIPVTIPLVQNVCLTILDAKLKRMFRSVLLCGMALGNIVLTIVLVRYVGFWGAATATALSLIVGHGIVMNVYYQRVIGMNVLRMFREIFRGALPCGLVAALICAPLLLLDQSWMLFVLKAGCFCGVYAVLMWFFGCNRQEKNQLKKLLRK